METLEKKLNLLSMLKLNTENVVLDRTVIDRSTALLTE